MDEAEREPSSQDDGDTDPIEIEAPFERLDDEPTNPMWLFDWDDLD